MFRISCSVIGGFDQSCREQGSGLVCQAQRGAVSDFVELLLNRSVYFWVFVPVEISPNRGICVEVLASVDIMEHGAFTLQYYDWLALYPIAHLSERVPDEGVIKLGQGMHLSVNQTTTVLISNVFKAEQSSAISDG